MHPDKRFMETFFVVEANDRERNTLFWQMRNLGLEVKHDESALTIVVGRLAFLPVRIACSWLVVSGRRVLFWRSDSMMVDHNAIASWFDRNCVNAKWRSRPARTDANNFHLVTMALTERPVVERLS